jgi:hypothetical protein
MSVQDLATMLAVNPSSIVKSLFMKGLMVQVTSTLDPETVKLVGQASAQGLGGGGGGGVGGGGGGWRGGD